LNKNGYWFFTAGRWGVEILDFRFDICLRGHKHCILGGAATRVVSIDPSTSVGMTVLDAGSRSTALPPLHKASIFAILLRRGYEETSFDGQVGGQASAGHGFEFLVKETPRETWG